MNSYKKRGLISILTMVLVIGLLSTAQAVNTDSDRRHVKNGDGNNNNRDDQARTGRTGRTGFKTVKVPTSTSVTTAPTVNSVNTEGNNLNGDGNNNNSDKQARVGRTGRTGFKADKVPASDSVAGKIVESLSVEPHKGDFDDAFYEKEGRTEGLDSGDVSQLSGSAQKK